MKLSKLPTRDECKAVVENSDVFYVTKTVVNGFEVEMYDYRMATLADFMTYNAYEMRGLTFVNVLPDVWERHLLLNKFFNLGQCPGWLLEDIKNKSIRRVQDKLDGSIVSFVRFPDGTVKGKSKMSFTSYQALKAQELYDKNANIRRFVFKMQISNLIPVFEYISMYNQIVVPYGEDELRVIQIRDVYGNYMDDNKMKSVCNEYGIKMTEDFSDEYKNLDFLLDIKATSKRNDIEGFVVTFEDGQMAKIKTDHYIFQHGLVGPDAFIENLLISAILEESIDDVISALVEGPKKDAIMVMVEKIQHKFNHLVVEYKKLRGEFFNVYGEDRKEFSLKYAKKHELFGYVMSGLKESFRDVEDVAKSAIKSYMLDRTKTLSEAKRYLEGLE